MKIQESARLGIATLLLLCSSVAQADCVILLHGLARSAGSMETMAEALQGAGFSTVNVDYPSTEHSIETLAPMSIGAGLEQCSGEGRVNFVTHSLGGILIREYLSQQDIPNLGRVVMLGPPNGGSEVVDSLGDFPGFYLLNGEAGQQLGTGSSSLPNRLGPANFEVGIIAGTRTINLILSAIIPGEDDGKVSLVNTRLEGMSDFIALPVSHPFLMTDKEVIRQTLQFLQQGHFDHSKA